MLRDKPRLDSAKRKAEREFALCEGEKINYKTLGEILDVSGAAISRWHKAWSKEVKREDFKEC